MAELMHRFYCAGCEDVLYSISPVLLAKKVNEHTLAKHPTYFAGYTEGSLVNSVRYRPPNDPRTTRPEYVQPLAVTSRALWGDAKSAPDITAEDLKMLKENKITW